MELRLLLETLIKQQYSRDGGHGEEDEFKGDDEAGVDEATVKEKLAKLPQVLFY